MDDQMVNGNHYLVIEARNIMMSRVKEAQDFRKVMFEKRFNFDLKEALELDPDKKEFVASEKEFQDAWNNIFTRKKTPPHAATKKHQDKTKRIPRHYKYNNIEE